MLCILFSTIIFIGFKGGFFRLLLSINVKIWALARTMLCAQKSMQIFMDNAILSVSRWNNLFWCVRQCWRYFTIGCRALHIFGYRLCSPLVHFDCQESVNVISSFQFSSKSKFKCHDIIDLITKNLNLISGCSVRQLNNMHVGANCMPSFGDRCDIA